MGVEPEKQYFLDLYYLRLATEQDPQLLSVLPSISSSPEFPDLRKALQLYDSLAEKVKEKYWPNRFLDMVNWEKRHKGLQGFHFSHGSYVSLEDIAKDAVQMHECFLAGECDIVLDTELL